MDVGCVRGKLSPVLVEMPRVTKQLEGLVELDLAVYASGRN